MNKALIAGTLLLVGPPNVLAGMPSPRLTELGEMRFESLSFFLAGFFFSAWVFQGLWNVLRREFLVLPRLGYWRSVGMVTVWCALFVVVLTMISGARELLTPGAWEKVGLTFKLKDGPATLYEPPSDESRRLSLVRLKDALWKYAASHDGQLPTGPNDPAVASDYWTTVDPVVKFAFVSGGRVGEEERLVAFEPRLFAQYNFGLFANGTIRPLSNEELGAKLALASKQSVANE